MNESQGEVANYASPTICQPATGASIAVAVLCAGVLFASLVLIPLGNRAEAAFDASIPVGQDADDIGGEPMWPMLAQGAWFFLLPFAAVISGIGWWFNQRLAGVVCLIDITVWMLLFFLFTRHLY